MNFPPPWIGGLGWDEYGTLLHRSQPHQHIHDAKYDDDDGIISSNLELKQDTVSLRLLQFQITNDGIRYELEPENHRTHYSIMGLRIQFTVSFQQPLYVIIKYKQFLSSASLSETKETTAEEANVSFTGPRSLPVDTRRSYVMHKIDATESHRPLTQIIKVYNAFCGQQYEVFIVGNKAIHESNTDKMNYSVVVNNITVQAFPVSPKVALSLYQGKTKIIFDKLFDIKEYEQRQIVHVIRFLTKFAKMLLHFYRDHELAEDFVDYCQEQYFCRSCQLKAEKELEHRIGKDDFDSEDDDDDNDDNEENIERAKYYHSGNYLSFQYCCNEDCIVQLIRNGDHRRILEDPQIRRMIIIKQEELPPMRRKGDREGEEDGDDYSEEDDEGQVYFNIYKWKWREAKVQRRKRKAILAVEREQYDGMADCFKLFCPKCKVFEPYLDARARRTFQENEEARELYCLKKHKPFIPKPPMESKCFKCSGMYTMKTKVDLKEWNERMKFYAYQREEKIEKLRQQYEKPTNSTSRPKHLQDLTFSKKKLIVGGKPVTGKQSLLLKDLTKEGVDAIFRSKQIKKKSKKESLIKSSNDTNEGEKIDEYERTDVHASANKKTTGKIVKFDYEWFQGSPRSGEFLIALSAPTVEGKENKTDDGTIANAHTILENKALDAVEHLVNHAVNQPEHPQHSGLSIDDTNNMIGRALSELALEDEWDMAQVLNTAELFQSSSVDAASRAGSPLQVISRTMSSSSKSSKLLPAIAQTTNLIGSIHSNSGSQKGSILRSSTSGLVFASTLDPQLSNNNNNAIISSEELRKSKAKRPSSLPMMQLQRTLLAEDTIKDMKQQVEEDDILKINPALLSYVQYGLNGGLPGTDNGEQCDEHHHHHRQPKRLSDQLDKVLNARLDKMFEVNPLENSDQGKSLMRSTFVWKSGLAGIFPLDHCSEVGDLDKDLLLVRITCIFDEKQGRYRMLDPNSLLDIPCPCDSNNQSAMARDRTARANSSVNGGKQRLNVEIRYFFGFCRGGNNKAGQFVIPKIPSDGDEQNERGAAGDEEEGEEGPVDPMEVYARGYEMQHHKRCEYLCSITKTSAHASSHTVTVQLGGGVTGLSAMTEKTAVEETYGLSQKASARSEISFTDSIGDEPLVNQHSAESKALNQSLRFPSTINNAKIKSKGHTSSSSNSISPTPGLRALSWKAASKVSDFNDNFILPEDAMFAINRISVKHIPINAIWCAHSNQRDVKVYVHELQFPVRMFDELTLQVNYGYFSLYSTAVKFALKELDESCPSMQYSVKETIYALEDHVFSRILSKPWNIRIGSIQENAVALFILNHEVSTMPLDRVEFLCDISHNKEFI